MLVAIRHQHPKLVPNKNCLQHTAPYRVRGDHYYNQNWKYFYESDEDFMAALRKDYKKIDIQRELQVVDLTNGGKIQPYVKGLQIENELNKVMNCYYE